MLGDQNLDPSNPPWSGSSHASHLHKNLKFSGNETFSPGGATITAVHSTHVWRSCGTGREKTTGGGLSTDHSIVNDDVWN